MINLKVLRSTGNYKNKCLKPGYMTYNDFSSNALIVNRLTIPWNTVRIRGGPAAVTGDIQA